MRNLKLAACLFTLVVGSPAGALEWVHINVVDSTTVVPGGDGGTFDLSGIGRVGLEDGMVYFVGAGGGTHGIYAGNWLALDGPIALYDRSTPVPAGGGITFSFFQGDPIMDHGSIVFRAKPSASGTGQGIYTDAWGPLTVVADTSTPVPGGTGTFAGFADAWLCDQNVVFYGVQADGLARGIYLHDGVTLRVVADLSTPIPGGTGNFTGFGTYYKNFVENGQVLFRGYGDGQEGVYLEENGVFTVIADRNTPVPGGEGNFTDLRSGMQLIDTDGWIIFSNSGHLDPEDPTAPPADPGAYAYDSGKLSVIVDKNTPVLGTTDTLSNFSFGGIHPRREISIFGEFGTGREGNIYSTLGGAGVQPVFSVGDTLEGLEVAGFGSYGWSVEGDAIAAQVYGAGFIAAVVSIPAASAVPLLSAPWIHLGFAALLLTVGLSSLAARRRS